MTTVAASDYARLDVLLGQWNATSGAPDWDTTFARLTEEWSAAEWRSGGKTLLAALGLQYREVALCRGLAWLLDPEGGHGMGRHLVDALLVSLDPQVDLSGPVVVRVEESRADTRADIVIRVGGQTVIIEAKVLAGEQLMQADRLAQHWAAEDPTLVFLTRSGYLPYTADKSAGQWVPLTWAEIARHGLDVAEREGLELSYGAREFIETIGAL